MSSSTRIARQSLAQVFWVPALLMGSSLGGLVLGLTGDGWHDHAAVILLALPLALSTHHWRRSASTPRNDDKKDRS